MREALLADRLSQQAKSLACALALVSTIAAADTPPATAKSLRQNVQLTLTEYRSGLRHEDGELACSRTTLRFRQTLISAMAAEGVNGIGCVGAVELYGREVYNEMSGRKVRSVRRTVRNGARARTTTGGTFCVRLVDNRWLIDSNQPDCR